MDPRIKGKLYWTGSSSEGTKMWLPDEFDFVMELVELKDCCYIEHSLRCFQELKLHQNCQKLWSNLCKKDCVLSPRRLKSYISALLWKAAFDLKKQNYPNIKFNLCEYDVDDFCFLNYTKVGVNIRVVWNGETYKNLTVSIDVTPAIPVVISDRQMLDLNSYAAKELADRSIHVVPYLKPGENSAWRVSFTLIEVQILKNMTKKQLAIYKCLKFLRDLHGNVLAPVPSYHLKTFLLTHLFQDQDEQYLSSMEKENFYTSASRVIRLLQYTAEGSWDEKMVFHFFLRFPLCLRDYDMRWCRTILKHLEST
ncbi:uncharacterized protein LOC114534530 [Dendronephthya gigantea]|uniref:uncharacterized protein LOC114534530 n=1 Tax=Dendronephthya gigantea TaxID=151771 RepID=UPI00106CCC4A|nr:uncharacterized protein LOC114534530 [Dendronephthya gigantea]